MQWSNVLNNFIKMGMFWKRLINFGNTIILMMLIRPTMERGKLDHLAISNLHLSKSTPKFFINSRENEGGFSTPRDLNPFLTMLNGKYDGEICAAA